MKHRILLPFLLKFGNSKSFKQFLPAFKVCFESGKKKTFSKTTGAT